MPNRSATAGERVARSSPRIADKIGLSNAVDPQVSAETERDPHIYKATSTVLAKVPVRSPGESSTVEAQASQTSGTAGAALRRAELDAAARFEVLQRWDGVVLRTNGATLTARLRDEAGVLPEAEADIFMNDISPDDRGLVRPGALLFWVIGYRTTLSGERERVSRLRMRRLPGRTPADIERAAKRAEAERKQFGWN